ncbi:MAG: NAD(P)-binding domain-containing protein [Deltaproteobacteria bacterium]|nr:NAD(P)-binding domain-containing protein [Deltaproteobacteria bacterium]
MNPEAIHMVILVTIILFAIALSIFIRHEKKKHAVVSEKVKEAKECGTYEPISLHPYIDPNKCIGSGACVKACHEKDVIGLSNGKGRLINASMCVGHGACALACPVGAITLVFGTAKRGVEIPYVDPYFETNVKGIYIAGELGGMGLIRNSLVQGIQAMNNMAESLKDAGAASAGVYDVLVVGAGPAGIGATLKAMEKKLNYLFIDQDEFGGTVANFPVRKIVMTAPVELPLYGKVQFRETTKETIMELWNKIKQDTGLKINTKEKLTGVETLPDGFKVKTAGGEYTTRKLLLCLGRRGTPRKLGVPGESMPKVSYRLIDPAQHKNEKVIVVGGGDSAVEAAMAIAAEGNEVILSYRKDTFGRIKAGNKTRLDEAVKKGSVKLVLNSNVTEILPKEAKLDVAGAIETVPNDYIYVFAGGELPNAFLKSIGLKIETHYGMPS